MGRDRALGEPGRARGEEDGGVVLGRDRGQVRLAGPREQRRERPVDRLLDRQRDGRDRAAARREPLGARLVGDDQLGLGEAERVAHLVGLPPAVDQGRDPARLQHRHVGDDPGRAVAHRDGDSVALGDVPAAGQQPRQLRRPRVQARRRSAARRRRSPPRWRRGARRRRRTASAGSAANWRRSPGPCASRPIWMRPAFADHLGQDRVIFAVERARHPRSLSFAFFLPPIMKARAAKGEALIEALLTSLATASGAIRFDDLGLHPVLFEIGCFQLRWYQPRLSRRHRPRLVVSAQAAARSRARRWRGATPTTWSSTRRSASSWAAGSATSCSTSRSIISHNPIEIIRSSGTAACRSTAA